MVIVKIYYDTAFCFVPSSIIGEYGELTIFNSPSSFYFISFSLKLPLYSNRTNIIFVYEVRINSSMQFYRPCIKIY